MKVFNFLIKTNLYLAISSIFLLLETQILLGARPQFHAWMILVFLGVLIEYNLNKIFKFLYAENDIKTAKILSGKEKLIVFISILLITIVIITPVIYYTKASVIIVIFSSGIVTLLYSFPINKKNAKQIGLRNLPYLKIFLISLIWSVITVVPAALQIKDKVVFNEVIFVFIERFIFVFAITLPFDIRDVNVDRIAGLKTIPLLIGDKKSLYLSKLSLFLFVFICSIHFMKMNKIEMLLPMIFTFILTFLALTFNRIQSMKFYHYGILDGMMIFQGLIIIGFHCIY